MKTMSPSLAEPKISPSYPAHAPDLLDAHHVDRTVGPQFARMGREPAKAALAVVVELHLAAEDLAERQADKNRLLVDLGFEGHVKDAAFGRQQLASDGHASNGPLGS
jgi:hypothetical protein